MNPKDLLDLAERCEREEPSYVLDCKIEYLCDPERAKVLSNARPYTVSLDAAVALVPKGWSISVSCSENGAHAQTRTGRSYPTNKVVTVEGRTMALALCAASLRARAAMEGENG